MSARKIETISGFSPVTVQSRETRLSLAPSEVRVRRNGVEFRSATAITPWTEMTVTLQSVRDTGRVHCTGVVVACTGSRHDGYSVSMVFTSLSEKSQARLDLLAYS